MAVDDGTGQGVPIDPGDSFLFTLGRVPSPGVDSLLFGLEGRSLSDPAVVQQYEDIIQCLSAITHGQGIGAICDASTPVLVSLVSADATPERALVRWSLGVPAGAVTIQRRAPGEDWSAVARVVPDRSGMVTYEDAQVRPGGRYGYRLGVPSNGVERMLYSSDHPWVAPQLIIDNIRSLGLPANQEAMIFTGNAQKLFKL